MAEDMTMRKSIELAVTTERLGAEFYQKMADKFSSKKEIADVFQQLGKDELSHEATFKALLEKTPVEERPSDETGRDEYLRATATSEFFKKDWFEKTDDASTPTDALVKAFNFEKATLLYYQAIRESLGTSPQLDSVIDAEKQHMVRLLRIIPTDARFRGLSDPW